MEEILIENLSFYRESPEDNTEYYIDSAVPLVIEILQFMATGFTIFQGVDWLRKWKYERMKSSNDVNNEKDQLQQINKLRDIIKRQDMHLKLLTDLIEMLKYHGWPEADAETDANKIMDLIL